MVMVKEPPVNKLSQLYTNYLFCQAFSLDLIGHRLLKKLLSFFRLFDSLLAEKRTGPSMMVECSKELQENGTEKGMECLMNQYCIRFSQRLCLCRKRDQRSVKKRSSPHISDRSVTRLLLNPKG
jgi:hypothetical protein